MGALGFGPGLALRQHVPRAAAGVAAAVFDFTGGVLPPGAVLPAHRQRAGPRVTAC